MLRGSQVVEKYARAEYLRRMDCLSRHADPFQESMDDIRKVYPVY